MKGIDRHTRFAGMERGWSSEAFGANRDGCHHRIKCRKNLKTAASYGETRRYLVIAPQKKAGGCLVVNDTTHQRRVRTM